MKIFQEREPLQTISESDLCEKQNKVLAVSYHSYSNIYTKRWDKIKFFAISLWLLLLLLAFKMELRHTMSLGTWALIEKSKNVVQRTIVIASKSWLSQKHVNVEWKVPKTQSSSLVASLFPQIFFCWGACVREKEILQSYIWEERQQQERKQKIK